MSQTNSFLLRRSLLVLLRATSRNERVSRRRVGRGHGFGSSRLGVFPASAHICGVLPSCFSGALRRVASFKKFGGVCSRLPSSPLARVLTEVVHGRPGRECPCHCADHLSQHRWIGSTLQFVTSCKELDADTKRRLIRTCCHAPLYFRGAGRHGARGMITMRCKSSDERGRLQSLDYSDSGVSVPGMRPYGCNQCLALPKTTLLAPGDDSGVGGMHDCYVLGTGREEAVLVQSFSIVAGGGLGIGCCEVGGIWPSEARIGSLTEERRASARQIRRFSASP